MQSSCQIGPFLDNPSRWVMSISLTSPRSCVENLISAKSFPVGTVEYSYLSSESANSILTWTVTFEKIYFGHFIPQNQSPYHMVIIIWSIPYGPYYMWCRFLHDSDKWLSCENFVCGKMCRVCSINPFSLCSFDMMWCTA